jgi:lysophospholipase L1-like esterase
VKSSSRRRLVAALSALTAGAAVALAVGIGSGAQATGRADWVGTWATGPGAAGAGSSTLGFTDQSVRMPVRVSVGGDAVRFRLNATFSTQSVTVGHATVALPELDTPELTDVEASTIRELTFSGGDASVVIPKGGQVLTDPLWMHIAPRADLVITLYFPVATGPATWHLTARTQTFVGAGDHAADPAGTGFTITRTAFYFLTAIDVLTNRADGSVAIIGDSITDGTQSSLNGQARWPDRLAERLIATPGHGRDPGILNLGMAGNAVTHDGSEINFPELGLNGLARLHRDVISQTGVQTVIVFLGINDIQIHNDPADKIIDGLRQLVAQIKERDLTVIICTLMPFEGFTSWTPEKETTRLAVNDFIRSHRFLFHAVIDFDEAMKDPAAPSKLRAEWDSGDHIHPNDAGYQAMADSVRLSILD